LRPRRRDRRDEAAETEAETDIKVNPAMTSAKRIKANRRNAKRSTGPKSAGGKSRLSMNALKHGLDAEKLILPGENEAEYQERLESWSAAQPPRDSLEASLLEKAVRLSWQLDRADRVCAAHLAERIQLLQSGEYRRQRADTEAGQAAVIGQQLLAGPPPPKYDLAKIHARLVRFRQCDFAPYIPIFDLPSTQAKMAQKRLGKPIPPERGAPENKVNPSQQRSLAPDLIHDTCQTDPDLARIVDAWPTLPEVVRAGIVAMVHAATK
jgi:hypothetical protein